MNKQIRPVRIGPYLQECPPRDALPRLFAGSWIRHNFAIWIGHEEDNAAWNALHETREHLRERLAQGHVPEDHARRAWEEIYIAEGSDWFWWYGDDHSSVQDEVFDHLFRKHLQNVYQLLGETAPAQLVQPIKRRADRSVYTLPRNFLDVKIDGRHTFFEWLGAGCYVARNERGSMAMITPGPLKEVHFGFDLENLLIRIDFGTPARQVMADFDRLRIGFVEPAGMEVLLDRPLGTGEVSHLQPQLIHHSLPQSEATPIRVAIDRIIEVAVPFTLLKVPANQPVQFFVELLEGSQSRDRAPKEATINLLRPSAEFEQIMWQV